MPKWFVRIILLFIFIVVFFLFHTEVRGERVAALHAILKPESIHVRNGRAYITETEAVHIVSLTSGELLKTFGKKGEGPGEFRTAPYLRLYDDILTVNTTGKLIWFDPDGNYIRERRHRFGRQTGAIALGDGFAAQVSDFSEKEQKAVQSFGIYDRDFNLIKFIFQGPSPGEFDLLPGNGKQPFPMVTDHISMDVYRGRVYISDTRKGFCFQVFDSAGNRVEEIRIPMDPVKVGIDYKRKALEELSLKGFWKILKDRLDPVFPDYFPEIRFFRIRDDRIYSETYLGDADGYVFRIYDLNTKKLSEARLPSASRGSFAGYDFEKGFFYYLVENEEADTWELHKVEIPLS